MNTNQRLWFGPIAAILFFAGIFTIGLMIPGYSPVRQTVSELGEIGSPGRVAFTILLSLVAVCLIIFASGIARALHESGNSALPAFFVGALAISAAGAGIFAFPHTLHNVFGMSELVGYQAPLVAALVCRRHQHAKRLSMFSIVMYVAVLLAIAANLTTLHRQGDLWAHVQPYYGVVQRLLFAAWFFWCAGYAVLLLRARRPGKESPCHGNGSNSAR